MKFGTEIFIPKLNRLAEFIAYDDFKVVTDDESGVPILELHSFLKSNRATDMYVQYEMMDKDDSYEHFLINFIVGFDFHGVSEEKLNEFMGVCDFLNREFPIGVFTIIEEDERIYCRGAIPEVTLPIPEDYFKTYFTWFRDAIKVLDDFVSEL